MGTTLTGTTPQDTYDSLIKVTDNGPLSGTAKYLSDGLGNDSVLALSTARVGINTASPSVALEVDGAVKFSTSGANGPDLSFGNIGGSTFINNIAGARNYYGAYENVFTNADNSVEFARINSAGNVGIGTDAPNFKLDVDGSVGLSFGGALYLYYLSASNNANIGNDGNGNVIFSTGTSGVTEKLRILAEGGLTFNGDTAQANALDDYEEGTWTMGVSFGGASVGVTTSANTGTYTKIGRQVTVNGFLQLTNKGSSTGNALITGMPFTAGNTNSNYAAASIHFYSISFANQMFARVNKNSTDILLAESTEAGVWSEITDTNFANDSEVMVLATYFV
jgi:hypothetical protein